MKKLFIAVYMISIPILGIAQNPLKDFRSNSIHGCWTVIGHFELPVTSIDDEDIKSLSKQKICIESGFSKILDNYTADPTYKIEKVNTKKYLFELYNTAISKKDLDIKSDSIIVINVFHNAIKYITKSSLELDDVLIYDGRCLFIDKGGVVFKLKNDQNSFSPIRL